MKKYIHISKIYEILMPNQKVQIMPNLFAI